MDRKLYIVPGLVALTTHALILLGSINDKPVSNTAGTTILDPIDDETRIIMPPIEEPASPSDSGQLAMVRQGTPLPGLEDTLHIAPPESWIVPPSTSSSEFIGDITIITLPGVPNGMGDGAFTTAVFEGIVSSDMLDSAPSTRLQVSPRYPHEARVQGIDGTVVVDFMVNEKGEVARIIIVSSTSRLFEEAARAAIARWRFSPGLKNGKPVCFKMRIPVTFKLDS